MALVIQNLFMPPVSPFLCIETGYFLRHGTWWTEFTLQNCLGELHFRIWEWFLGSILLAPLWAAVMGGAVYLAARFVQARRIEA